MPLTGKRAGSTEGKLPALRSLFLSFQNPRIQHGAMCIQDGRILKVNWGLSSYAKGKCLS